MVHSHAARQTLLTIKREKKHSMFKTLRFLIVLLLGATAAQAQPKALFYMTRNPDSVRSFMQHVSKIDIIVPTWYSVDKNGMVWGGPNPLVLTTAKEHHVPVMPIVSGMGFHTKEFHAFLHNDAARTAFEEALPRECKLNGYSGFQIDFEDLTWNDRDALSSLVAEAAAALHRDGYKLSIATVPNAPGRPGQTAFGYWIYRDWRGVYDLKALAKSVDLICLMTYDQHTMYTAPGPVGGYPWTLDNLNYALKWVPKDKLSLGIPLYGYHWYAGMPKDNKGNITGNYISEPNAELLARSFGGKIQWDPVDRTAWFYIYRDYMREWVFFTDARTFQARYNLVKERGLQGFCSWVLGNAGPDIWNQLPSHN